MAKNNICNKPTPMGMYNCDFPKGHTGPHSWDKQPDNATPRPWFKLEQTGRYKIYSASDHRVPVATVTEPGDAALIVKAVNEHAALEAIAAAAFNAKESGYDLKSHDALCEALANYDAIRGQKAGGK